MRVPFALLLLAFGGAVQAAPVTIDFSGDLEDGDVIQTQGFEFTSQDALSGSTLPVLIVDDPGNQYAVYCPTCLGLMTNIAGQPFSLQSVDFTSLVFFGPETDATLTVTGFYSGGGQVSQTVVVPPGSRPADLTAITFLFGSGWNSLVGVEFGATDILAAVALDNIVVDIVPIPAAVWLFGSALVGMGWFRRAS
ncbi:MAG: hypothetical protein HKN56_05720 [Gammaproteobacteria bacterium]|nr:hypothetical protein [Gammaproteobacteria bacterium]